MNVSLPSRLLRRAIRAVVPAASSDPARSVLCGVRIALFRDALELAATDSFRAHRVRVDRGDLTSVVDAGPPVVVPAWFLDYWSRSASASYAYGDTAIVAGDGGVSLRSIDLVMTTNAIDGTVWPNVNGLIDSVIAEGRVEVEAGAGFNPKYLAAALKAANVWNPHAPVHTSSLQPRKPAHFVSICEEGRLDVLLMSTAAS